MAISKIACACITWGDRRDRNDMRLFIEDVRTCGYDGIEIGLSDVDKLEREDLKDVSLYSGHTGIDVRSGDIVSLVEANRKWVERDANLNAQFVFISSPYYAGKSEDEYKREFDAYNLFGKMAKEYGLGFCFHNHHWEFKNGAKAFNLFLQITDPQYVSLVPDMGWVVRGDVDPVQFVQTYRSRIRSMHFKEFTFDEQFTELGKGIVPFGKIFEAVRDMDIWIVAEQDKCLGLPIDSAMQNANYLRKLIKKG
jgi:sugar phosphate isomerase/epimerase